MAKKKLVITEVENLFQNSSRKSMSTKCDMGFRFLEGKNLKLCNEWVESVDGVFKITYYDDFIIPETIPINGENYRVTEIGEFTIIKSMESLYIPESIAKIDGYAFNYIPNSPTTRIQVSENNKYYDSRDNCNAIIETKTDKLICASNNSVIPDSVKVIGVNSFEGCMMENIIIPNAVIEIESEAFRLCKYLKNITIPALVEKIRINPFAFCPSLSSIKVSKDNMHFDSRNDCNAIIETRSNILLASCINTIIPNTVEEIGEGAFEGNKKESIIIPSNVRRIGENAFRGSWIKTVMMEESVSQIKSCAFIDCGMLEKVVLSKKLERIESQAFELCVCLRLIDFPVSLQYIGFRAFASCRSLKSVLIKNKKAQVHKKAFDDDVIINGKPRDYWLPIEGDFLDLQKT